MEETPVNMSKLTLYKLILTFKLIRETQNMVTIVKAIYGTPISQEALDEMAQRMANLLNACVEKGYIYPRDSEESKEAGNKVLFTLDGLAFYDKNKWILDDADTIVEFNEEGRRASRALHGLHGEGSGTGSDFIME